jgi:hypothetical protein
MLIATNAVQASALLEGETSLDVVLGGVWYLHCKGKHHPGETNHLPTQNGQRVDLVGGGVQSQ